MGESYVKINPRLNTSTYYIISRTLMNGSKDKTGKDEANQGKTL